MLLGLEQYLGIDPDLLELLSLQGSSSQVLECPTSDTEEEHEEVVQGSTCKDDYHDHQCQSQQQMKLQDKETLKSFHDENKRLRKYEEEKMDPKTPEDKGEMDILKAKTSFQAEFDNGRPGLLFLLSGKQQNAKSRRKRKTTKATSGKCDSVVSEASEAETSFDSAEFERTVKHQNYLSDLEDKMYGNGKSVSLKDYLRKPTEIVLASEDSQRIEIVEAKTQPQPLETLELLGKKVHARNLFDGFPRKLKNSKGKWTLKVRLRISPEKLAIIKRYDNPFTTRGTTGTGTGAMSKLMAQNSSLKVSLKLPVKFLKEIERSLSPLYTKSSGHINGKPARSVFEMMMQSANKSSMPKLTPIQKLKELYPPILCRSQMHVVPDEVLPKASSSYIQSFPLRDTNMATTSNESLSCLLSGEKKSAFMCAFDILPIQKKAIEVKDITELVKANAPLAFSKGPHKRIYKDFIMNKAADNSYLVWPQKFQPQQVEDMLLPSQKRAFIKHWIENAFKLLKAQSTRTPLNVRLKEQQRRQKQREASAMSGFIVDDFEEDETTDEDIFVPILIVKGPTGSCKSSSIYAAMNAMDGYVHEINTSQQRSRRDIYGPLKEFCTTQIVNQNGEAKKFQKGVVLFEDCDVLFEQDKTFWTLVQDVLNFSKRPIVLTVSDDCVIPRYIKDLAAEQNSIISLSIINKESMRQYIWLCSLSQGYSLSSQLQEKILSDCHHDGSYDLRKALMMCQWLCGPKGLSDEIVEVLYFEKLSDKFQSFDDVDLISKKIDLLSAADIISRNTVSSILHDRQENELLDVYVVDDSLNLTQPALPHEVNVGGYIQDTLQSDYEPNTTYELHGNQLRDITIEFLSSRSKPTPAFLRDIQTLRSQTRSRSSATSFEEIVETQGLPETSVCYSMPKSSIALDLAPVSRAWAQFQKEIMKWDAQHAHEEGTRSLENFLNWRKFHRNVEEILKTI